MVITRIVECMECGCSSKATVDITLTIPEVAHGLIEHYKGPDVSAGDVEILSDAIRKCLVSKLGVSKAKVQ